MRQAFGVCCVVACLRSCLCTAIALQRWCGPAWTAAAAPTAPKWTTAEVNKMTVPKLKAALTELGLATDGLKKVLKERLLAAL